jgi:hypothetical protein
MKAYGAVKKEWCEGYDYIRKCGGTKNRSKNHVKRFTRNLKKRGRRNAKKMCADRLNPQ